MPLAPVFRYHAYLSHVPEDVRTPDRPWVDWVAEALQTFEVPRPLAGRPTPFGPIPPRLHPVCKAPRPESGAPLSAEARTALEQSRTLVVICSPRSAQSPAVQEEVRFFKQLGRDRVIALIVEGEPDGDGDDCFTETLKYEVKRDGTLDREWRIHPIAIDARGRGSERLSEARRLLAAAIIGVPPEALPRSAGAAPGTPSGAPDSAGGRRGSGILGWLSVLALATAGAAGWLAYRAHEEKRAAEAARARADELIVYLQRSVREKLAPIGQIGVLAEINERVIEHLARVASEHNDPAALGALADAFRDSAEILIERGNPGAALEPAIQAVQTRQRIVENRDAPADTALRLIGDQRLVARIYLRSARPTEALSVAEQSRTLAAVLSRKRLGDLEVELELARCHATVGNALLELNKLAEASLAFVAGRDLLRQLLAAQPRHPECARELASLSEQIGNLKQRQADLAGALTEFREWQRVVAARAAAAPADVSIQAEWVAAQFRIGSLLAGQRRYVEAVPEFQKAAELAERVAKERSGQREAQFDYVKACRYLGAALAEADPASRTEALAWFQRALDHLKANFPGDGDLQAGTMRIEIEQVRDAILRSGK